jgi:hypothetical protein
MSRAPDISSYHKPLPEAERRVLAERLLSLVKHGGPIKRDMLAFTLHCTTREVRRMIADLVARGEPLVSGADGYRYSTDPEAIEAAARQIDAMARALLQRGAALRKITLRQYSTQLVLDLEEGGG